MNDPNLSPAELRALNLICHGRTQKEAAGLLFISPKTLAVHLFNIRTKLSAKTTTFACIKAIQAGIITLSASAETAFPAGATA